METQDFSVAGELEAVAHGIYSDFGLFTKVNSCEVTELELEGK